MNRRMFFALLGAPAVAKNPVEKVVSQKWPQQSFVYFDREGMKTVVWKYKVLDFKSQVA